jgi:hypothetical protein
VPGPSIFRFVALATFIVSVAFALSIAGVGRAWVVVGIAAAFLIAVAVEWITLREVDARWRPFERSEAQARSRAATTARGAGPVEPRGSRRPVRPRPGSDGMETAADAAAPASGPTAGESTPGRPAPPVSDALTTQRARAPSPEPLSAADQAPVASEELERKATVAEAFVPTRDEPPEALGEPPAPAVTAPADEESAALERKARREHPREPERVQAPPEPGPPTAETRRDDEDEEALEARRRAPGPRQAEPTEAAEEDEPEPLQRPDRRPTPAAPSPRPMIPPRRPSPPRPVPPPRRPRVAQPPSTAGQTPAGERGVVRLAERRREPRAWNVWDLERAAREEARRSPGRSDEWSYLLLHLRQFAEAGGNLPPEFDGLVRESFGSLLERLEPV